MANLIRLAILVWGDMKNYTVKGYDKTTGQKKTITIEASTSKSAKTQAYQQLTYPKVEQKY